MTRALMFIALDKLANQGLRWAIIIAAGGPMGAHLAAPNFEAAVGCSRPWAATMP